MNQPTSAREQLRQSLGQLHAQLIATPLGDPASRALLREVLADIERLLAAPAAARPATARPVTAEPAAAGPAAAETAPQRLEALAVEFEARHPALAGSLRQFIDLLGRGGV